jgi:Icc-related predicted phosphoesterase
MDKYQPEPPPQFVLVGDTHWYEYATDAWVPAWPEIVPPGDGLKFLVHVGDIHPDADVAFRFLNELAGRFDHVIFVPGNHDKFMKAAMSLYSSVQSLKSMEEGGVVHHIKSDEHVETQKLIRQLIPCNVELRSNIHIMVAGGVIVYPDICVYGFALENREELSASFEKVATQQKQSGEQAKKKRSVSLSSNPPTGVSSHSAMTSEDDDEGGTEQPKKDPFKERPCVVDSKTHQYGLDQIPTEYNTLLLLTHVPPRGFFDFDSKRSRDGTFRAVHSGSEALRQRAVQLEPYVKNMCNVFGHVHCHGGVHSDRMTTNLRVVNAAVSHNLWSREIYKRQSYPDVFDFAQPIQKMMIEGTLEAHETQYKRQVKDICAITLHRATGEFLIRKYRSTITRTRLCPGNDEWSDWAQLWYNESLKKHRIAEERRVAELRAVVDWLVNEVVHGVGGERNRVG